MRRAISRHPLAPAARARATLARATLTLASLALAGCNAFSESYVGDRLPPVDQAKIVTEPPPETQARLIGESTFVTTDQFQGDDQALATARAVGANLVQWERGWDGQVTKMESMPIYQRGVQNRGTFATYVSLPDTKNKWRYYARFWRLRGPAAGAAGSEAAPH